MPTDHLIEDVEFLLDVREHPEKIARRVGYASLASLIKRLERLGRLDLTHQLRPTPERAA